MRVHEWAARYGEVRGGQRDRGRVVRGMCTAVWWCGGVVGHQLSHHHHSSHPTTLHLSRRPPHPIPHPPHHIISPSHLQPRIQRSPLLLSLSVCRVCTSLSPSVPTLSSLCDASRVFLSASSRARRPSLRPAEWAVHARVQRVPRQVHRHQLHPAARPRHPALLSHRIHHDAPRQAQSDTTHSTAQHTAHTTSPSIHSPCTATRVLTLLRCVCAAEYITTREFH